MAFFLFLVFYFSDQGFFGVGVGVVGVLVVVVSFFGAGALILVLN